MLDILYQHTIDDHAILRVGKVPEFSEEVLHAFAEQWKSGKMKQFDDKDFVQGEHVKITHLKRKIQWYAARYLLAQMLNIDWVSVEYDEFGKPSLKDRTGFLSISHSGALVAVIFSDTYKLGVDVERIEPKIERIARRFLRDEELNNVKLSSNRMEQLYVYWTAKESLYKLYRRKKLNFKENMVVHDFEYEEKGQITATILKLEPHESYQVNYEWIAGYMMAYVVGN